MLTFAVARRRMGAPRGISWAGSIPRGRLFGMLVFHLDDSGEETDPVQTMAGFVTTTMAWAEFEAEANDYFLHKGVPYLSTKELYPRKVTFKGWNSGQTKQFAEGLFRILAKYHARGVEFSVLRHVFKQRKIEFGLNQEGSPYGFCFKGLSNRLKRDPVMQELLAMPGADLSFVVESGHKNDKDVLKAFNHWKTHDPQWRSMIFEDKKKLRALQVADFLAFFLRRIRVAQELKKPFEHDIQYLDEVIYPTTYAPFLATDFHGGTTS
jgi:hypothetical protein